MTEYQYPANAGKFYLVFSGSGLILKFYTQKAQVYFTKLNYTPQRVRIHSMTIQLYVGG